MTIVREDSNPVDAEAIAGMADAGEDVSRYFTGIGRMMEPVQSATVPMPLPQAGTST
jgi:hypothetical protein